MSDYLGLKSALARPITIPVPKGIPGELFVMGTVYEPINQDHTGTQVNTAGTQCLRAMSGQIPLKSFAVYGSRPFLANEAGSTTLAINVLQHTKPAGYGVTPFAYSIPSPTVPINNTADLKCRDGMNPRTCANRGLFQIQFNLGVSHQILIRQPLPPHPQTFLTRLNLANGQTSPVMNSFIIPKESPLLISYINGTKTFDVVVQYFTKQLSFNFNGVRYTQILAQCPAANPVFYAGNVPEDGTQEPSLPLCGSGQHNFTIRDLGEGFN
jgi:hypothetical protein